MARSQKIRWLSVVLGAALTISGVVALAGRASSTPHLPAITPQQLIASMVRAAEADRPISGQAAVHIDLGLPSLPDQLSEQAPGAEALLANLSGDHRLRVWHSADGVRVADLLSAGERSLFVSRRDAWAWDSRSFTAYHLGPFPARTSRPAELVADPGTLASKALAAITPTTAVSMGQPDRIAGRDAYVLVLQPRTDQTLIGRIDISVDASRRVPLAISLFPRGSRSAAVSATFTSVGFDAIAPSTFEFTPPAGARVVRVGNEQQARPACLYVGGCGSGVSTGSAPSFRLFGKGWSQVFAFRLPSRSAPAQGGESDVLRQLLPFSGPLFSARMVDRGDHSWLIGGFVPQSALAKLQAKLP
jgi:hypothetical protein